jgi:predicted dehydrogenase
MDRKILIVGAGLMFRVGHLPALKKLNVSITAVVEPSDAVVESIKPLLNADVKFYKSLEEVALESITHALVATPAGLHSPIIKELAKYNIHVLCEKPIAINAAEANELRDIYSNKNNVLQIGFQRRFFASSILIKKFIEEKTYGNLSQINIWAGWLAKNTLPQSILNKKMSGGGITLDYGVHFIDLLHYWAKDVELLNYFDDSMGGIEVNAVTYARMKFEGMNSAGVKMYQSWTSPIGNNMQLYFDDAIIAFAVNDLNQMEVTTIDNQNIDVRKIYGREVIKLTNLNIPDPMVAQWEEFFAKSENTQNKTYLSSLDDAIKTAEFIDKCYKNKQQLQLSWGL